MAQLQYIGARYIPVWYHNSIDDTANWEPNVEYEPLTWVTTPNNHLYLSKKTVPDNIGTPAQNTQYWLDMGVMTGGGSIEHLQEEIDGIVADIGDLEDLDTTDKSSIVAAINEVLNNMPTPIQTRTRKFLFVGDSYMTGEASGAPTINSFTYYFGQYTGLVEDSDYWVAAYGGYGFKSDQFKSLMETKATSMTQEEKDSITDVVVLGGVNDNSLITSDLPAFETAMNAFVLSAKSLFTNAVVRVGYISKMYDGRFNVNKTGIQAYKTINRHGGYYVNGIENVLRDTAHFQSDGHPSADGQRQLGRNLVDALYTGACNPAYQPSDIVITPASGITVTANELKAECSNGVVTIYAHNWSKFTFASRSFTSPTDPLYVGETEGIPIGESDAYKYIPVTLVLVGSPNNYQIEGKMLFQNKGLYIFPWQQLTVPTGITELRVAPFSFCLNTSDI